MLSRQVFDQKRIPVVHAAAPTVGWASRLFPQLQPAQALIRLNEKICHLVGAHQPGARERAAARSRQLAARMQALDALQIREVRITGEGSDLRIGFSSRARWQGDILETTTGQSFQPNVPCEEVFTCPHRQLTEGRLVATRPWYPAPSWHGGKPGCPPSASSSA